MSVLYTLWRPSAQSMWDVFCAFLLRSTLCEVGCIGIPLSAAYYRAFSRLAWAFCSLHLISYSILYESDKTVHHMIR